MSTPVLIRGNSTTGQRRVEAGLLASPLVALELVAGLLVLGLTVLRVDEDVIGHGRGRSLHRRTRLVLCGAIVARGLHNFVLVLIRNPLVVRVVRVVVRDATEIDRVVVRRQYRHEQAERHSYDHESGSARGVPDTARIVVAATTHNEPVARQFANAVTARGVIVVVSEPRIHVIE